MAVSEVGRQVAMAAIIIALLLLIIITPSLMGERETDISILPQVLVDRVDEVTTVYVSGALSNYRYESVRIEARDPTTWTDIDVVNESQVFASRLQLPGEDGTRFALWILVWAEDLAFEYNATIEVLTEATEEEVAELLIQPAGEDPLPIRMSPFTDTIPRRET